MFQQFQGGIQPVTGMSEAGANIGNAYAQGISSFGAGLAEGIKKYQENVEKNEILNAEGEQLGNEIIQFAKMFGDNPEYQAFADSLSPDIETLSKLSSMSLNQKQGAITGIKARFSRVGNQLTAYEMLRKSNLERDIAEAERRAKKTYKAADPRGIQAGKWDFDPTKSIGDQEQEFAGVLDRFRQGGIIINEDVAYDNLYDQWERSINSDTTLPPEVRSAVLDQLAAAKRDRQAVKEGYGEVADIGDYLARFYQTGEHYQTGYSSGQAPAGVAPTASASGTPITTAGVTSAPVPRIGLRTIQMRDSNGVIRLVSPEEAERAQRMYGTLIEDENGLHFIPPAGTASDRPPSALPLPTGSTTSSSTPTPAPSGLPAPASAGTPAPARPAPVTAQPAPEPPATSTPALPPPASATRTAPSEPTPALPPPASAESKPKSKKKQTEGERLGLTPEQVDDASKNKQRALKAAKNELDIAILNNAPKSELDVLRKEVEDIKAQGIEFFLPSTEAGSEGESGTEGDAGDVAETAVTAEERATKLANEEIKGKAAMEIPSSESAVKKLTELRQQFLNRERTTVNQFADWLEQTETQPFDTDSKTILNETIDEINDKVGGWFWRKGGEDLGLVSEKLSGTDTLAITRIIDNAITKLEAKKKESQEKFKTLSKTPLTADQILAGNTEAKPVTRQPLGRVATMGDILVGYQEEQKAVSLEDKKREMADFLKSRYKDKFGNSYVPAGFENIFRQLNPEANLQIKETPYGAMMWDGKEWKQLQMPKSNSQSIKEMRDASRGLVGSFDAQGNIRPTEIIPNSGVYIGGIFTGTDARYDKYLDEVTDLIEARNAATELEKINNTFGSSIFPTLKGRADVLVSRLKAGLRTDIVGVGTVSNYEQALIEQVIAKPQDFWRLKSADRMRLIEVLKAVEYGIKSKSTAFGLTVHIKDTSKNSQTEQELRQRLIQSGKLK